MKKAEYTAMDSWYGKVKIFSSLRDAKKACSKDETIFFNGNIVGYGNKEPNTVS